MYLRRDLSSAQGWEMAEIQLKTGKDAQQFPTAIRKEWETCCHKQMQHLV